MTILKNDKAKFKATLGKYLNTQFFSSVDEFSMFEDYIYTLFCKIFAVLYTVKIVYICVFMTCSTSYCPVRNLWMHVMYICKYFLSFMLYGIFFGKNLLDTKRKLAE
jgi:hypothetical protein